MTWLRHVLTPNDAVSRRTALSILVWWMVAWLAYWSLFRPAIFPSPLDVLAAVPDLWFRDGLGQQMATSWWVNAEALVLSTALALPVAYLSRVPAVAPIAVMLSKVRFLSPAVFFLILLWVTSDGHAMKVWMLTLGEVFFLLTTAVTTVQAIPAERFDDARTLRMGEWLVTWYVVVRGTLADLLAAIRDNAAMGWCAVMYVESMVRSEGGVGVMLLNQGKFFNFGAFYAVALAIILVGVGQDYLLGAIRRAACPYADLVTG